MAFLYNTLNRKILLTLILSWSLSSFFISEQQLFLVVIISLLSLVSLIFIWLEKSPVFLLVFNSFLCSFALYVAMFYLSFPFWLLLIAVLILFGFIFTYTEQKIGILGNQRLIYLLLFTIVIIEFFFALSYFLISPLNKSLIIAVISYLLIGYCYTILAKHDDNKFATYIIISVMAIILIMTTSNWGSLY